MKTFFRRLRALLLGQSSIAVGHCFTRKGSAVLLMIGRKRAGITPDGARKIADQLRIWADHAEEHGRPIQTMKWIVSVTRKEAVEAEAMKWAEYAAEKVEDNRTGASQ